MQPIHKDIIILGSGPAGATAAIYAARALHSTLLLSGGQYGGQLTLTQEVENFPGFVQSMNGMNLIQAMLEQAKKAGAEIKLESIKKVQLDQPPFLLESEEGNIYSCNALIIATGAKAKWLGLESEEKYRTGGVSACAICDGFFYKDQDVIVVGGGNSALDEALYLAKIARKVTIIHRRDHFTAEAIMQQRIFNTANINIIWDSVVEEIIGETNNLGQNVVTNVKIFNKKLNISHMIPTQGVFIAIGHEPQSEIFKEYLELDANNYIQTKANCTATNINGVFAAGDVADNKYRQAITAAAKGCMAAIEANEWLMQLK